MAVYLDNNATTPLDERVLEAMLPYFRETFGNPSSPHRFGRAARGAVDRAREQVAALVGAHPSQVIFTSGGTEANNLAVTGIAAKAGIGRIALSAIEHASVLASAASLKKTGWHVDTIPADPDGRVPPRLLGEILRPETRLVSVMAANNETGVLQEIPVIADVVREKGCVLHTDAVQAAGKIPVDFSASGVHLMSLSAHKIHGPKGVGALVMDKSLGLEPRQLGGGQERGRRGGTEAVAAVVGFGAAAELAQAELQSRATHTRALRNRLEQRLGETLPHAVVLGGDAPRLPNTAFIALAGIDGETLLLGLDQQGFALSSGAACGSSNAEPSHVLKAMGVSAELARCTIRVSLSKENSEQDVDAFVTALRAQIERLTAMASVGWS